MTPANRDTLREGMARAEIEAKFGPEAVDLVFDTPAAATDKQRALFHARAEEARRHADQALTFLAPILDKADSAEAAASRTDRLSAEVEALRATLTDVKAWIDTDLPAGTPRAGIVHAAIWKALDRTALARAAVKAETEGVDHG